MSIREIIAAICIFIGLFVFLCSILGIYRFKYAMNRMHAAALGDTMGIFFVVLGLLILGQDIFHMEQCCEQKPFPEYVRWIFDSVRQGTREYPHFFTAHSISVASSAKEQARKTMEQYFSHMKAGMAQSLRADPAVRRDAFSASFSESDLIDFVLSNLLTLLARQEDDCEVLLEVIRRVLYPA